MSTTKKQPYLDAWLAANPKAKNAVAATSAILPEGASREEQDLASIYASAAENATAIERRAQQATFDANKANDLASKYLAAQNQANGLGGLGIADTSSLRLSSIYQKALSDANATREQSLMENYLNASEKADTVRGEWASREEVKAEQEKTEAKEKYTSTGNAILLSDDEDRVKQYLAAAGYAEGTDDYNSLLNRWMLSYGESQQAESDVLNSYGIENKANDLGKVQPSGEYYDPHRIIGSTDAEYSNTSIPFPEDMAKEKEYTNSNDIAMQIGYKEGWKNTNNQIKSLANVLEQSKTWGVEKNGTYVDFNDGKGESVFVFYNGRWYKTNKTKKSIKNEKGTLYGVDDF